MRPFIVFEDADVDAAVTRAMLAKMRNIGEPARRRTGFFVQEVGGRTVRHGVR